MQFKKGAKNILDEETLLYHEMIPPIDRADSAKRSDNPIRRFREELRLTLTQFSKVLRVSFDTARSWERPGNKVYVPSGRNLTRMIEMARRNNYPLLYDDMVQNADKGHGRVRKPTTRTAPPAPSRSRSR